ncbi:hypothetical protein RclHR1_00070067 [Rhizophagus clarus]|uniref:F-box domain-containing protein n=1 Tax=Rhizophagus clarus TaxID=94130 RepID=A0A2Z6SAK5_9GLOM|nr:hypothetical protein RclHR1_00070067 [Rhizophagus clarus]GES74358.1 hypothetical protein GLOIN_2v1787531 [Rhizophagus clarus]
MTELNIDCLNLIFKELRTDRVSLYPCLLVNKTWCSLIVPILWEKHSWCLYHETSEKKLFNIIISSLPSTSKQILTDNNINLPSTIISKPLTFNYISFCKFFESETIDKIIRKLFNDKKLKYNKRNLLEQEIYKLFVSECNNIKELELHTSRPLPSFPGALTFFSNINKLTIKIDCIEPNTLHEMAKFCIYLNELTVHNCSQDNSGLISLIDAQKNLKIVSLYPHNKKKICEGLREAIGRKGGTINNLCLYSINIIPLISLYSLERLLIYNFEYYGGNSIEMKKFLQYLEVSKFPNLQFLNVLGLVCHKELAMLIKNTEGNLLEISISSKRVKSVHVGIFIKSIADNCPKIKNLSFRITPEEFQLIKLILLNCRNLVKIKLDTLYYENDVIVGDELLDDLAKFSPKSLTKLTLSGNWKFSIEIFEKFLESCREHNLILFGITNKTHITEEHKTIARKYVSEGVINEFKILCP